jgi:hypothetical protein
MSSRNRKTLEQLSAYLDGELSKRDAARLEARLQDEPDLLEMLEQLRQTVHLVGTLPEVSIPRSFTLTPEMAGIKERPRVYPVMRLATAVAAVAFFALVGVDALTGVTLRGAVAPAAEMQRSEEVPAPAVGALDEGEVVLEKEVEVEPITEPEEGIMAFADETEGAKNQVEGTTVPSDEELRVAATPMEEVAEAPILQPTPTIISEVPAEGEALGAGEEDFFRAPEEEVLEPTPVPEATAVPSGSLEESELPITWSPLRIVEITLGVLVLLLASVTLWIRKTSQ